MGSTVDTVSTPTNTSLVKEGGNKRLKCETFFVSRVTKGHSDRTAKLKGGVLYMRNKHRLCSKTCCVDEIIVAKVAGENILSVSTRSTSKEIHHRTEVKQNWILVG